MDAQRGRTARARAGIGALALAMLLSGCAAAPGAPAPTPRGEWAPAAAPRASWQALLRAYSWKGIEAGVTTRAEVDKRFKPIRQAGKAAAVYRVDQIDTTISYGPEGRVASIRLPPASLLSAGELRQRFGDPDRTRQLAGGAKAFDYERAGLTVEYPADASAPVAVEMRMPAKPTDDVAPKLVLALVPIRPPLTDIPRRVRVVQDALSASGGGFSWVTASRESQQAAAMAAQLQSKDLLLSAPDLQAYADGVIARLASVTPAASFEWKLGFMRGVLPNAMNLGGGYIFMTQGLLEHFDTEAELACVLAHEMVHQLKGHVATAQTRAEVASLLVLAAEVATRAVTGVGGVTSQLGGAAAQFALAPFSRAQETEADLIAMDIVAAAGYDPRLALSTLERLKALRAKYGTGLTILSSHPELEARQEQLRRWLDAHGAQDYSNALVTTQEFIAIRRRYRLNPW